eukprot:6724711-Prymnesium_polylepis.1
MFVNKNTSCPARPAANPCGGVIDGGVIGRGPGARGGAAPQDGGGPFGRDRARGAAAAGRQPGFIMRRVVLRGGRVQRRRARGGAGDGGQPQQPALAAP